MIDRMDTRSDSSAEYPSFVTGDITSIDLPLAAEIGRADLVVLAVPEQVALACVEGVAGAMRPGALLVDTLSVKGRIVDTVRAKRFGVEAVSLNPMFAPALGIEGRPVATVVVHDGPRAQDLLRLLGSWGGRVVALSAYEHDRLAGAAGTDARHGTRVRSRAHRSRCQHHRAECNRATTARHVARLIGPDHFRHTTGLLGRAVSQSTGARRTQGARRQYSPACRAHRHGNDVDFTAVFDRLHRFLGRDIARYRDICVCAFEATGQ
jgi:4-amino-4-deoxyprephenate dehydrogenase